MRPFTSLAVLSMPRLYCGGVLLLVSGTAAFSQAPAGPMTPRPGSPVQQTPPDALNKITARVTLVSTPVTVRDSRGGMIHDLELQDFLITDNGVPQRITHFDIGGELHSQYMLSYSPPRSDDGRDFGYHKISVALVPDKAAGRKINARPGYYIPPPGS